MMTTVLASGLVAQSALSAQDDMSRVLDELARLRAQNEQIAAENAALSDKVERLERHASEKGVWLTDERAREIRAVVTDVLSDSAARTNLAGDAATSGWDKSMGFFLSSADGNYLMVIRGDAQFRWNYNHRDIGSAAAATGSVAANTNDETYGFEWRRARVAFAGNVIDPSWTYEFKFANNRNASGSNTGYLDDAWVQKSLEGGYTLRMGQFKAPFLREEIISTTGQLAVERSLVNEVFSVSRSQGISFGWMGDELRVDGFYGDALRANAAIPTATAGAAGNVAGGQNVSFSNGTTDYAFAARAEFKPMGDWKQFKDAQSYRGESTGLLFGVAGYMEQMLPSSFGSLTPDVIWGATADATVDLGGASILVYAVYRDVTLQDEQATRGGGTSDEMEQWGALVQGGVFVTDDVELFARYEVGSTDTDQFRVNATAISATGEENSILTAGVNWWPVGSKQKYLKLSADLGYSFDPLVDFSTTGAGWLPDYTDSGSVTSDGQWVLRTQLQFMF
jgi:hypothetical protein